jgi:exonuclease III
MKNATTVADALKKHVETIPTERKLLVGEDWNVVLSVQDRVNHIGGRTALAQQINILICTRKMIDIWRRFHPDSKHFTYRGNQATSPKSRLDRIRISENWLHQTNSVQICPYFADHAGYTPIHESARYSFLETQKHAPQWHISDFMITIIQYYSLLAIEDENIIDLSYEMEQEIRLQARR